MFESVYFVELLILVNFASTNAGYFAQVHAAWRSTDNFAIPRAFKFEYPSEASVTVMREVVDYLKQEEKNTTLITWAYEKFKEGGKLVIGKSTLIDELQATCEDMRTNLHAEVSDEEKWKITKISDNFNIKILIPSQDPNGQSIYSGYSVDSVNIPLYECVLFLQTLNEEKVDDEESRYEYPLYIAGVKLKRDDPKDLDEFFFVFAKEIPTNHKMTNVNNNYYLAENVFYKEGDFFAYHRDQKNILPVTLILQDNEQKRKEKIATREVITFNTPQRKYNYNPTIFQMGSPFLFAPSTKCS